MSLSTRTVNFGLCLSAIFLFATSGCNSAGVQAGGTGSASNLSGPPVIIPAYQGRAPRQCTSVTAPPSVSQATAMVQCWSDAVSAFGLFLYQDVKVQIGSSRPYLITSDSYLAQIDPTAIVYPIRGSYTSYACHGINNLVPPGKQCSRQAVPQAMGMCWKTSFGDWKCYMQGNVSGVADVVSAPITY